jgi:hypothetical protein
LSIVYFRRFFTCSLLINTARIEKVTGIVTFFADFLAGKNYLFGKRYALLCLLQNAKRREGNVRASLENTGREGCGYLQNSRSTPYINWDKLFT